MSTFVVNKRQYFRLLAQQFGMLSQESVRNLLILSNGFLRVAYLLQN